MLEISYKFLRTLEHTNSDLTERIRVSLITRTFTAFGANGSEHKPMRSFVFSLIIYIGPFTRVRLRSCSDHSLKAPAFDYISNSANFRDRVSKSNAFFSHIMKSKL